MFSDFDPSRFVADQLNGDDRPVKADAFAKHHSAATDSATKWSYFAAFSAAEPPLIRELGDMYLIATVLRVSNN